MDFTPKIQKCISSLKKFESAETSQTLLDKPASIWLSVGLQNLPSNLKSTVKPHRIPITNSIRKNDTVCVIIKDQAPQKEVIKAIENIEKVYSFSKLKQFSTHEAKRAFCNGYDFFLADERILPMLPQKLGKTFFKKKKQPVPIELSTNKETMEKRIFESIHQSTYLFMNFGSCW
ncbi:ribosomal protein L1 [Rozella allomycis CSF55]|nr:ribosomal protein L1 [Rozella allomycis CSF55]